VQFELGFYELLRPSDGVKAFELQADCMAGLWGNAVYQEGRYDAQDVEQAISTAQAVGDFDFGTAQHHGTPDERRAAWLDGFRTGDPARCRAYVPGT
jgi:predicted metalloprotease